MKNFTVLTLIFSYLIIPEVLSFELTAGVISKGRDTIRNEEQKRVSPIIKSSIKEQSGEALGRSIGYTNLNSGNVWYRVTKDLKVHGVNVGTKLYLGNWPLTTQVSCDGTKIDCEEPWWAGRWNQQEFLEPLLKERFNDNSGGEILVMDNGLGCLSKSPLRYGDIDKDTKNELFLFLN